MRLFDFLQATAHLPGDTEFRVCGSDADALVLFEDGSISIDSGWFDASCAAEMDGAVCLWREKAEKARYRD